MSQGLLRSNSNLIARVSNSAAPPKTTSIARAQQRLSKVAGKISDPVLVISVNGGFIRFPWPDYKFSGNSLNPDKEDMEALQSAAEEHLRLVLSPDLLSELQAKASFLTLGIDSNNSDESKFCELVSIVDLKRLKFRWTGKFYPCGKYQETRLYRNTDLDSHFIKLGRHKVMVL